MDYVRTHAQKGFTLIEILIAFALVAVLGGIAVYSYQSVVDRNARTATLATMRAISDQLETYRDDVGEYPAELRDLIVKPADEKTAELWQGPYLQVKRGEIRDGWGKPFQYKPTPGAEHEYELISYGSKKGKTGPKSAWLDVWKKL